MMLERASERVFVVVDINNKLKMCAIIIRFYHK